MFSQVNVKFQYITRENNLSKGVAKVAETASIVNYSTIHWYGSHYGTQMDGPIKTMIIIIQIIDLLSLPIRSTFFPFSILAILYLHYAYMPIISFCKDVSMKMKWSFILQDYLVCLKSFKKGNISQKYHPRCTIKYLVGRVDVKILELLISYKLHVKNFLSHTNLELLLQRV